MAQRVLMTHSVTSAQHRTMTAVGAKLDNAWHFCRQLVCQGQLGEATPNFGLAGSRLRRTRDAR
jgi:hypothetical protein